ncbi:Phosphoribosylaminoimidazole-succinocarboxamide synthase [Frankliniella fusca]|uniref:Phosphoribosylaminoimidazole-succinocarboxamide synthase n=1 Tax=Frankliniella fusca TaxID=407009 RepID=A0AAE1I4E1_9NEOP|nr:Phosphoribosylaminoimidazole-succinocarboxamide synthase [Frankliniella fusca]
MLTDEEFTISFSSLERGQMYPIKMIQRTESTFNGKLVRGIKVVILDDDVELVTYLPSKLVKAIDDKKIEEIKAAGLIDEKYKLCYYGKMQKAMITEFYGRIHPPTEGRLEKLYNDLGKIMTKYTPEKRRSDTDDGDGSSKKVKIDES